MGKDGGGGGGGPNVDVSDEEVMKIICSQDKPGGMTAASEISSQTDLSSRGARLRLGQLVDRGWLESDKPGNDRLYWLTDAGQEKCQSLSNG
jgi:predicted ArsR family transcriptional regulator